MSRCEHMVTQDTYTQIGITPEHQRLIDDKMAMVGFNSDTRVSTRVTLCLSMARELYSLPHPSHAVSPTNTLSQMGITAYAPCLM
jgi:hypothetical protein